MKNFPTAFQRSSLWTAITALSITVVGALGIGVIYLATQVIAFLQPILMPTLASPDDVVHACVVVGATDTRYRSAGRGECRELAVGDVIPDWGGRDATFTVADLAPPGTLVHTSARGRVRLSWAITLSGSTTTRVHLRLRLGGVRRERLARVAGGFFDWLTIVGLAAGLRERLR